MLGTGVKYRACDSWMGIGDHHEMEIDSLYKERVVQKYRRSGLTARTWRRMERFRSTGVDRQQGHGEEWSSSVTLLGARMSGSEGYRAVTGIGGSDAE